MRLLQLWLNLPKKDRWTTPRVQDLPLEHVPALVQDGVEIKLYSGSLAGLTSPMQNYTPMIVADISLEAGATTVQQIPANYNTFLYIIRGSVQVGEGANQLDEGQVGWLNLFADTAQSDLLLTAGSGGVRFVLYAGKPTGGKHRIIRPVHRRQFYRHPAAVPGIPPGKDEPHFNRCGEPADPVVRNY